MPDDAPALPSPSVEAAAISRRLGVLIRAEIAAAGGWIPFSRFMELALYAPGLGYYSAGAVKVGSGPEDGSDFTTAPELSPLFTRAVARSIADVIDAAGGTMLELGAGRGTFAADALRELEALDALPSQYAILEVSADLRERQRSTLTARVPHLLERVVWLDAWPDIVDGVVFGNEVLDALPVDLVVRSAEGWADRGVVVYEQALAFGDRPVATRADAFLRMESHAVGYVTERHGALEAFVATLVGRMSRRAAALFMDYGFPASEYFHPQRDGGTLMAHYRHRATSDVLDRIGLQDLTAHVDFSAIARVARTQGADVDGYTSQSAFLIASGIGTLVDASTGSSQAWARDARALQVLLTEAEMGELFKVIALSRAGTATAMRGFATRDRRRSL